MRNIFLFGCAMALIAGVAGCATFNAGKAKAAKFACEYRATIVALALTRGDVATADAITAYCDAKEPVVTATETVAP